MIVTSLLRSDAVFRCFKKWWSTTMFRAACPLSAPRMSSNSAVSYAACRILLMFIISTDVSCLALPRVDCDDFRLGFSLWAILNEMRASELQPDLLLSLNTPLRAAFWPHLRKVRKYECIHWRAHARTLGDSIYTNKSG